VRKDRYDLATLTSSAPNTVQISSSPYVYVEITFAIAHARAVISPATVVGCSAKMETLSRPTKGTAMCLRQSVFFTSFCREFQCICYRMHTASDDNDTKPINILHIVCGASRPTNVTSKSDVKFSLPKLCMYKPCELKSFVIVKSVRYQRLTYSPTVGFIEILVSTCTDPDFSFALPLYNCRLFPIHDQWYSSARALDHESTKVRLWRHKVYTCPAMQYLTVMLQQFP
jgi:hypothetical protein